LPHGVAPVLERVGLAVADDDAALDVDAALAVDEAFDDDAEESAAGGLDAGELTVAGLVALAALAVVVPLGLCVVVQPAAATAAIASSAQAFE
jgi:hypothetical protein